MASGRDGVSSFTYDGESMKADEKLVDAAKGFQKLKEATRRVLAVPKEELERREAAWKKAKTRTQ